MKPRILQLTNDFNGAGSERQAALLTRTLHETGRYDVFMACIRPDGQMYQEMIDLGIGGGEIPSYPLTSFYNFNAMKQLMRFVDYIKKQKIDIVQTHDFYTNIFGMTAAKMAGISVRIAARRETDYSRSKAQLTVEKFCYKTAHAIVTNADAVRNYLMTQGLGGDKIHTIYNGLNFDRLIPKMSREEALVLFKLPGFTPEKVQCKFVIITANLNHSVKDYPTFLRAAQLVRKVIPEARFVSGGRGHLIDEMKQLSVELGIGNDVFFLDWCNEVGELLSLSNVCVLSSKAEGFSNSIVEYSAAGRPIVATDVGGAREAIINKETGYLVDVGDYKAMAAHIIELLQNPIKAREMGNRAQKIVRKRFSTDAQLERTEQLYHLLLSATSR